MDSFTVLVIAFVVAAVAAGGVLIYLLAVLMSGCQA